MQARLICPAGKLKGRTLSIVNEAVVGRSGSGITIPDDRVSSKHARIYWVERDGCFYIEDLGSTNGTNVAGRRISGPERLEPMDVVNFGGAGDFVFQVVAPPLRPETPSSVETQLDQSMTLPPLEPETNVLDPHAPIVLPPRLGDADRTSMETNPPVLPDFPTAESDRTIVQSETPALPKLKPRPEEDVTRKE